MTSFARELEVPSRTGPSLASMLDALPPGRRGALFQYTVSFQGVSRLDQEFHIGPIRAAFADYWERRFNAAVPIRELRRLLEPPIPIATVLKFSGLMVARDLAEMESAIVEIVTHLAEGIRREFAPRQLSLIETGGSESPPAGTVFRGGTVHSLAELISDGRRFPTIYADPPCSYDNEASRGAAINHYPTMSLDAIRAEPVGELAEKNAHLHLWTTNAFLREAFDVIDTWGFEFKSCLVWIKSELGMGNYWRVSHKFLLLGVRGNLTFCDRTLPSWIQASRTSHSRKPAVIRALIERVSPGPYLELYGREELPDSAWTVYGNDVEPRFF